MARNTRKPSTKDILRRRKKKISILTQEQVDYVDWKDINLLRRFMSDRAKIRARLVTGNNQQQQTEIAKAIKNAREMALLPYTNRITTQRSVSRTREDERLEDSAPQPSEPPPRTFLADPNPDIQGEFEPDDSETANADSSTQQGEVEPATDVSTETPSDDVPADSSVLAEDDMEEPAS